MNNLKFFANVGLQAKPNLFLGMSPQIYKIIKYYRNKGHINDLLNSLDKYIVNSFKHNGYPQKSMLDDSINTQIALEFALIGEPIPVFNYLKKNLMPRLIKYNVFCERYKAATDSVPPMGYYNSIQYIYEIWGSKFVLMSFMHNLAATIVTHAPKAQEQSIMTNFRQVIQFDAFMQWVLSKISVSKKDLNSCSAVHLTKIAIKMAKFLIDPAFQDQSSGLPATKEQKHAAIANLRVNASYYASFYHKKPQK